MIECLKGAVRRAPWFFLCLLAAVPADLAAGEVTYAIVDSAQVRCYSDSREIAYPGPGADWFGQDAHYAGNQPSYKNNGDGTVSKSEFGRSGARGGSRPEW